jgi:hypothetical protein
MARKDDPFTPIITGLFWVAGLMLLIMLDGWLGSLLYRDVGP